MNTSKIIVLVCIFIFNSSLLKAQDTYNPWSVGLSVNAINNPTLISNKNGTAKKFETWNQDLAGFKLSGSRYIKRGFVFQTDISLNSLKEIDSDTDEDVPYISTDGLIKFSLNTNSAEISMFDPYICVGGGYTWVNSIGSGNANAGLGLNLWLSDHFGINIQSTYKHAFKDYGVKHFQHSAGVAFKFGGVDTDNDGIFDNEDNCPNDFGLIQFNGCPDSDGDGIEESIDECPLIAGPKALKGCPDKDGDGVADKNDECPDQKGSINTRGCPDKDKDGVPDKFDRCPEIPGSTNNRGCPWKDTDKDGVLDKDDKCPLQIGPVNNNGCPFPKLTKTDEQKIGAYASTILFDLGKADLKSASKLTLNNVVIIMKNFPSEKFRIEGHSDNTFTKEYNLTLSRDRANNVKEYLIKNGISASRLSAEGFGEDKPIATNDNAEGRQKNRRVEILLLK